MRTENRTRGDVKGRLWQSNARCSRS